MKWFPIIALFFVSCGSDPISQPFMVRPIKQTAVQVSPPEAKRKTLAGKVTFTDLTKEELAAFRVVPESGKKLMTPKNTTYDQVDGLWWRGTQSGEWFKIPGASQAWVGKKPERFDGIARKGDLEIYYRSNAIAGIAGFLKKTVKRPSWVKNTGPTRSPVPSPWHED